MTKELFDIRHIEYYQCKNTFTGSIGKFRYSIAPIDDVLKAQIWYGNKCIDVSEVVAQEEFPCSDDGLNSVAEWLEEQYNNKNT